MASKRRFNSKKTNNNNRGKGGMDQDNGSKFNPDERKFSNDPSWYTSNAAIAQAAANMPFNIPAGSDFQILGDTADDALSDDMNKSSATAGALVYDIAPAFGQYADVASPLNIASQALYSYVRHANSGSRNYDAPDLMTYVLAMTQVYSYINWMQRVYGAMTRYSTENRYFGEQLINAMHVNYHDLLGQMANFAFYINMLITKAAAFAVPESISLFKRQAFLYRDIFIESTSIKDQLYLYNPIGFYMYNPEITPDHPTATLDFHTLTADDHYMTLSDIIAYGNNLIQPLLDSEDIGIASGDILKAYGNNILHMVTFDQSYSIAPIYDSTILEQFKNATILGAAWVYPSLKQDASKRWLVFNPEIASSINASHPANMLRLEHAALAGQKVLTTTQMPSSDVVMENTRLTLTTYDTIVTDTEVRSKVICGSEVVVRVRLLGRFFNDSAHKYGYGLRGIWNYAWVATLSTMAANEETLCRLSQFQYAPAFLMIRYDSGTNKGKFLGLHYNVDNFTLLDTDEMKRIHEAAWVNMIAVPQIGLSSDFKK